MTLAKITAAIATIFIATAPPAPDPSWWKDVSDEDMELLALHIGKADEITVRDAQTVTRLYFDHQVLETFEQVNREMVQQRSAAIATPQQILDTIENLRATLKAGIVEAERKQKEAEKKSREESTWRTYPGKDA